MRAIAVKALAAWIFSLSLFIVSAACAPVDFEAARRVARNHLERTRGGTVASGMPKVRAFAGAAAPYHVIDKSGGGFVVVSGDDIAVPILGEVDAGTFDSDSLPPAMRWLLGTYERQIEEAIRSGAAQDGETGELWKRAAQSSGSVAAAAYPAQLLTTTWAQQEPYNLQCPVDGTKRSVTGCVATVMSQIMKYWRHPVQGTGASEAYITKTKSISVPSVSFNTPYDYADMLDKYTASGGTTAQRNAVAALMYHSGLSVKMDYTNGGSGAYAKDAAAALTKYFDYDNSIRYVYSANSAAISASDWKDLVIGQIENSSPVYYSGQDVSGGHAFIIDGYNDGTDRFHLNWGWGGPYDGFFALTALNPDKYWFSEKEGMIINIMPNQNGNAPSQIKVSGFDVSTTRTGVSVSIRGKMNYGVDFSGKIGLAVMSGGDVGMVLDSANYSISNPYTPSTGRYTVNYRGASFSKQFGVAGMPSGNLTLQVVTKRGSGAWTPVGETRRLIAPYMVAIPAVTAANLVYTGEAQSAGIEANDFYTVIGDTAVDAGGYEAVVALKDTVESRWADGTTGALTLSWSIAKAAGAGTVAIDGWAYGEAANDPVATGGAGDVSYAYRVKAADADDAPLERSVTVRMRDSVGNSWNSAALRISVNGVIQGSVGLTAGGSGVYTFTAEADDEIELHWLKGARDGECAFAVYYTDNPPDTDFDPRAGAENDTAALLACRLYGSLNHEAGVELVGSFAAVRADDAAYGADAPVNAGSYTVRATFAGSGNYRVHTATADFVIEKLPGTFEPVPEINVTYTPGLTLNDIALPTGCAWADTAELLSAGNGYVFAAVYTDSSGNYTTAAGEVTVNVAKADPAVTWPDGFEAATGQTLAAVPLAGFTNAGGPAGAFSWEAPDAPVGEAGARGYNMVFTPADSANYNSLTQSVTLVVTVSVTASDRAVPSGNTGGIGIAVAAPVNQLTAGFYAGPNPVRVVSQAVEFFRQGKTIKSGRLSIYDANGNLVRKINISDNANASAGRGARRHVGSWDLRDSKGRAVPAGTYLVSGRITDVDDGRVERVAVIVGVRF